MPSTSSKQRRLMGAALSAKRGNKTFPMAQKIAGQMTEPQLKDFAKGPVKPKKPKAPPSYL
jgi:Protein of unknwon function (DUF3008)